jgi:hypothetical protein
MSLKCGAGASLPVSIVLLAVSVYIRLQLKESPAFMDLKAQGQLSKAPLTEAFARWPNLKLVLLALFGATAGQAVVWYGGQFYALFFLEKILQLDSKAANLIIAAGLLIGTPFFVVWGSVSVGSLLGHRGRYSGASMYCQPVRLQPPHFLE